VSKLQGVLARPRYRCNISVLITIAMDTERFHANNPKAGDRAMQRSTDLIIRMLVDMATLVTQQRSLVAIMRYMIACFNYRTPTIVIGSYPYSDKIVPSVGSSYSQRSTTRNTPTIDIIRQHFTDDCHTYQNISMCIRESWKTLRCGCAWLNATYVSTQSDNTRDHVKSTLQYYYTIEFICMLISHQVQRYNNRNFTVLAIGREAQFIAS
jgi:hypothetical protein